MENLCLIFAGKIMKDTETLASHNVKDGMTVHLVIKQSAAAAGGGSSGAATSPPPAAAPAAAPVPPAPADIGASPFGIGGFGGIPGLGNLGMGSANFMEMQQRMQRDLLANPDMMRQVSLSNTNQSMQDLVLPLQNCTEGFTLP